ncbi:Zinc finger protein [Pseudolycoriella hygida]|uniref:Zinc finger protein n=1 Tax=Pseudolycoriella hygida TaxID=35572 RepID=A0A9Q0MJM1_9DIPT|nr:Zinc finger protein [Pseudolycoriella hygida]
METDPLSPSTAFDSLEVQPKEQQVSAKTKSEGNVFKNSSDPLDFICFVCHNEFDDVAKLHVHMSMKHKGIKPYRCEYCGKAFATTKSVGVHLQVHHFGRSDKYLCLPCKSYFRGADDLSNHNALVHKKSYQCGKCCKCFSHMSELTAHERMHSFNKPFHCERCDESFMSQSSLSLHVHRVHKFSVDRQIHCPLCDYSFSKQSDLNAHLYVHDEETLECPDCGELFDNLEVFTEHMEIHEKKVETTGNAIADLEDAAELAEESDDFMDDTPMDDGFDDNNESNLTKMGVILSYTCPICFKVYSDVAKFNSHCEEHNASTDGGPVTKTLSKPTEEMLKPNRPKTKRTAVSLKWQENDNKIRNFSCEKCNRSFTMASTLSLHLRRTHLGIKPYKCQVCEWTFAQSSEKPYSCTTCGARFSQKRNLRNHMKMHTDEPSICKYCHKKFLIDTSLVQHLKKHEPNVTNCTVCKIPFSNQDFLDKHSRRCMTKDKHQCTQCDKSFAKAGDLVKHNRKHTGERPFVCTLCNKTFSHPTSLRNHGAVHTKLKPFICSYCGQAFSFHGNLKVHLVSHSGEKPFSCHICGKSFARSANLKEHVKIHTGEKNYKCAVCEKSFTNSSTFSKHKKIHSGEKPHHCSFCDKRFSQHAHLVKHTRIHTNEKPYGCDVCNKYFRRSDTLANHLRTHLKDDRNNYHKLSTADPSDQSTKLQVPVPTLDVQLIQQSSNTIEDVPQIIYTITTPANVTGVTADQINMELLNDAQTNPHFIITSL